MTLLNMLKFMFTLGVMLYSKLVKV